MMSYVALKVVGDGVFARDATTLEVQTLALGEHECMADAVAHACEALEAKHLINGVLRGKSCQFLVMDAHELAQV